MILETPEQTSFKPVMVERYALLTMDQLGLLIPQQQVRAIKPALDVQRSADEEAGWITVAGINWPVYCMSEDLQLIHEVPAERQNCVLLQSSAGLLGVLCNQVDMLEQAELDIRSLPRCMRTPGTPLQGLVLHGERVLCVTSTDKLLICVGQQQCPADQAGSPQRLPGRRS